ncbi:MAG: endonuclease V [Candidatus Korarchaeum sp.]|nr:endonuclease V [Candidatus Korarchaeum sp.]
MTTFKAIAEALGDPRAALTIRNELLRVSRIVPEVPWWRVISSNLEPLPGAREKLRKEGGLTKAKNGDLFRGIEVWPVFKVMASAQIELSARISLEELSKVNIAAGVDVSYYGEEAVACCVALDEEMKIVETRFERFFPQVPYVPTYLAFRELRGMLPAAMKCSFDVVFVDGHGILHPRGFGEASHLGFILNKPSIGVAKSLLTGSPKGDRIYLMGREVGIKLRGGFISPGHMSDLKSAISVAERFWRDGNQPLPLRLAHSLSKGLRLSS